MHLYLHIGTGRTGTQSLQDFLKHNSQNLAEHGIYYPLTDGRNHHNPLALPVCGDRPPRYLMSRFGKDVAQNLVTFHAYFDTLEGMIRDAAPKNVILSSEFLGRNFPEQLGQPLFERIRALFDEVTVVVYFRSPASYYLSAALQTLKASGVLKHPSKSVTRALLRSYAPLEAKTVVREYNRDTLIESDVCQDFISIVAPDLVGKLPVGSREKNETLSAEVMSIIQDYRNEVWPKAHNIFNAETDGLLETLLQVSQENGIYKPPQLRPELAERMDALDEDMIWLRDTHGFEYSGIDYSATPVPVKKIEGSYSEVADICVLDPEVKRRIMLLGLAKYTANAAQAQTQPQAEAQPGQPDVTEPKKKASPAGSGTSSSAQPGPAKATAAPKTVFPGEISRIKALEPLLRLPEREVYDTPRNHKVFRETGKVTIRNNFPAFDLADLTDWTVNPTGNVVWRIYFNCLAWMSVFADQDVLGNEHTPDWDGAFAILEKFVSHVEAEGHKSKNDIWDDHATGYRASYISYLYTRGLAERISPEFNGRLRKVMMLHRKTLMDYLESDKWKFSNHTLFQAEGLADMAMIFMTDKNRRNRTLEFARLKVDEFIDRAVSHAEGTVKEHSIFYHVFLMGRLRDTCEYFERIGHPLTNASDEMFTRMNAFLHDVMPVPGRLPGIGDSKHFQRFDKKYVAEFQDGRFSTPQIDYHRSKGKSGTPHAFLSRYPQDGYFIFRSHDPVEKQLHSIFLHRSFRGPHGHWDGMSFTCHWGGRPLFIDSGGPYKYSTPMRYKYFQTQLAHNAPIFDRDPVELETQLLGVHDTGEDFAAVALGARMGKGRSWVRIFGQQGNRGIFLLDLPVSGSLRSKAEIRLHLDPEIEIGEDAASFSMPAGAVGISQSTLSLPRGTARAVRSSLAGDEKEKLPSHQVSAREREKTGLDPDFDARSYVTYKDNEMVDGKLLTFDLPANKATLTTIGFGDQMPSFTLTAEDNLLLVGLEGRTEPLLRFDAERAVFA